jgi:hypothetical protein
MCFALPSLPIDCPAVEDGPGVGGGVSARGAEGSATTPPPPLAGAPLSALSARVVAVSVGVADPAGPASVGGAAEGADAGAGDSVRGVPGRSLGGKSGISG